MQLNEEQRLFVNECVCMGMDDNEAFSALFQTPDSVGELRSYAHARTGFFEFGEVLQKKGA